MARTHLCSCRFARPDGPQGGGIAPRDGLKLVVTLKVHPTLGIGAEVPCQTQRGLSRNTAAAANDLIEPLRRNAYRPRERSAGQRERFHEVVFQHFTWVDWMQLRHVDAPTQSMTIVRSDTNQWLGKVQRKSCGSAASSRKSPFAATQSKLTSRRQYRSRITAWRQSGTSTLNCPPSLIDPKIQLFIQLVITDAIYAEIPANIRNSAICPNLLGA